jgi:hypothetical protein
MCEKCTPFTIDKFSSSEDFITFEKKLDAECAGGTFIRVVTADDTENTLLTDTYECINCGKDWVLSIPENAWHGYFLPGKNGVSIHQSSESTRNFKTFQGKGNNGCGCCLGMIFLFIALIIYIIYSFFSFLIDLF